MAGCSTDSVNFLTITYHRIVRDMDKDKDSFIGRQEFVVGYSKAPGQPQSSTRPICHSHAMTTIHIASFELATLRTTPEEILVIM